MCGRYTLTTPDDVLDAYFEVAGGFEGHVSRRFNVPPAEPMPIVRFSRREGRRIVAIHLWGLIPSWEKMPKSGGKMINVRAEGLVTSPAFRSPFERRRCLVPSDGFFEWRGTGRHKQPFYFQIDGGAPFAFAGLWDRWPSAGPGPVVESFTVITTGSSSLVASIHDRMPAILDRDDHAAWLDPTLEDPERLLSLLRPFPAERMSMRPVNPRVNGPEHDDPECLAPALLLL